MNDARIDFEMRSHYRGNLTEELRKDERRIEAFQKVLNKRPLLIPIKLDIQGATAQARMVKEAINREFAGQGSGGPILNAFGQNARSTLLASAAASGNLSTTVSRNAAGATTTTTLDQVAPGITRSTSTRGGKTVNITEKDVTTVRAYAEELKRISRLSAEYARAGAKGNITGQQTAIRSQIDQLGGQGGLLAQASMAGLAGSPIHDRAERRLDRLRETLARLEGRSETIADKNKRNLGTRRFERMEKGHAARIDSQIDRNDIELTRAKAITDRVRREQEVNRVLNERTAILERNKAFYQKLDKAAQGIGREDLSDKAFRRTLNADNALRQHEKDSAKHNVRENAKANAEIERQNKTAATKARADRQLELERMLQDEVKATQKRIRTINADERKAKAEARNSSERGALAGAAATQRQEAYQGSASRLLSLQATAQSEGYGKTALKARGASQTAANSAIDQMNRFTTATKASGHALDFHSNQLLRNAATFAKWYGPMQVVLGGMRALGAGIGGMKNVDRQFATLQAVFRGTAEDAQKLKEETLSLAVANGRSADEAMDAAVRFSRLGLTRVQVIKAVNTALMASNVAEVDAAYAAEKLSAIYATYKLTVDDLPVILNRLNAISNRYNVTNKDLLEGITRVASVAKNVGIELRDLEGMIGAAVGATGRTGQEIGTSLRYVITNTSRPEKIQELKDNFDFDMTKPTGELKNYMEILSDLAVLYPKLNSYEKQRILDITAGSRQADKFAAVLTNFNQAQALTIEASLDTNSAFDENRRIADSLEGQLNSLAAAWTSLWTAIGDRGMIDATSQVLHSLSQSVGGAAHSLNANRGSDATPVEDRTLRAGISTILNDRGIFRVSEKNRSRSEIEQAINILRKETTEGPMGWAKYMAGSRGITPDGRGFQSENGNSIRLQEGETWDDVIAQMEGLINQHEDTSVSALRERASGIPRLIDSLKILRSQVTDGDRPNSDNARDFEAFARAGRSLPGGAKLFAQEYTHTSKAISRGDHATGTAGIDKFIANAEAASGEAMLQFERARTAQIKKLNEELEETAKKQIAIALEGERIQEGTPAFDAWILRMKAADDEAKALKDTLTSIGQEAVLTGDTAIASFARLEQWFGRMRSEHDVMNSFREKLLAGEDSPLDRRLLTGRIGLRGPLDTLQGLLADEQGKLSGLQAERSGQGEKGTALDFQIRQHEEIVSRIKEEVRIETEAVELAEKKLSLTEQLMLAQGAINAGMKSASDIASGFGIGRNSSEQGANVFNHLLSQGKGIAGTAHLKGGIADPMTELGTLLGFEKQLKGIVGSMESRRFGLGSELGNLGLQEGDQRSEFRTRQEHDLARRNAQRKVRLDGMSFAQGDNETDRLNSELRGHMASLGRLSESETPDDPATRAAQNEEFESRRQRSEEIIFELMNREVSLLRERKTLEEDISSQQKSQTEEASKRLAFADREDQLRAAALSRTLGGSSLGLNEFSYLSGQTRGAISNFLPNSLPPELQDQERKSGGSNRRADLDKELDSLRQTLPKLRGTLESLSTGTPDRFNSELQELNEGIAKRRKDLTDELQLITNSLPNFRQSLDEFSRTITSLSGPNGPLNPTANIKQEGAPNIRNPKPAPTVLNIDQIQVQVQLASQFEEIVRSVVDGSVAASEKRMLRFIRGRGNAPNTSGTNSATE